MDESARLDVVYCEAWDSRSQAVVGAMGESVARGRDSAGDPYAVLLSRADDRPHALLEIAWKHRFARCWYFDDHGRRYLGVEYRRTDDDHLTVALLEAWDYSSPDHHEFSKQVRTHYESRFPVGEPGTFHLSKLHGGGMGGRTDVDPESLGIPVPGFGDWVAFARFTQPYRLVVSTAVQGGASDGVIAEQPWHPDVSVPTDRGRPIPGIEALARPSIRLHPRRGEPTVRDSHLGGPVAWPVDEPWPVCDAKHVDESGALREAALLAAAQFHRRDYPSLPFPEGRDLLQVLWCPTISDDCHDDYGPKVRLVWHDSTRLPDEAVTAPPPLVLEEDMDGEHLPHHACLIGSCALVEYPALSEVPPEIRDTLSFLDELGNRERDDDWPGLRWGSKIGGWTPWYQAGPVGLTCEDCGTDLKLLLSLHTDERPDHRCSCHSDEMRPVGWAFGREGALNIYACPADATHPVGTGVD